MLTHKTENMCLGLSLRAKKRISEHIIVKKLNNFPSH
nr:MAG TPA: hypothetical protein [Caudoviricetes sp.]